MIKKIISKILLLLLFFVGLYFLWVKSPLSTAYFYENGKKLYEAGNYLQAVEKFERILLNDPQNRSARFMYVQTLSKLEPDYTVQEALYKMANSKVDDSAKTYAKAYIIRLKTKLSDKFEENYIYNAIQNKDIIRWDKSSFPLKVYIEKKSDIPSYYSKNVEDAFSAWMNNIDFIKFVMTDSEKAANIVVKYIDYSGDECGEGVNNYVIATTFPDINKHHVLEKMSITIHKTNCFNKNFAPEEIYNASLHEIGHALGIMGHSGTKGDVMYATSSAKYSFRRTEMYFRKSFTISDINTITLLYNLAPTVTNIKNFNREGLYYAPLVLGNDGEIIKKKLNEIKQYINKYPNFASGYINISSIYANSGQEYEAFKALDTAENLARSQDEKYLVEYNRAILYYNSHNLAKALEHAQKAKVIKPCSRVDELINDIQILNTQ